MATRSSAGMELDWGVVRRLIFDRRCYGKLQTLTEQDGCAVRRRGSSRLCGYSSAWPRRVLDWQRRWNGGLATPIFFEGSEGMQRATRGRQRAPTANIRMRRWPSPADRRDRDDREFRDVIPRLR